MERQEKIQELIQEYLLSDQHEIVELLEKNYQIKTNQAQVSRDLRKLGVVKCKGENGDFYKLPHLDIHKEILNLSVSSIEHNGSLIVIKTRAGLAAFVADFIDEHFQDDLLGSIAGENTVFVTPRDLKDISRICDCLKEKLQLHN